MTQFYWIIGIGAAILVFGVMLICLSRWNKNEDEPIRRPTASPFRTPGISEQEKVSGWKLAERVLGVITCVTGALTLIIGGCQIYISVAGDIPAPLVTAQAAEEPGRRIITIDKQGYPFGDIYYQVNQGEPQGYGGPFEVSPQDKVSAYIKGPWGKGGTVEVTGQGIQTGVAVTMRATITANQWGDLTIRQNDGSEASGPRKVAKSELAELGKLAVFDPDADIGIMDIKGFLRLTISAHDLDKLIEAEGADEVVVTVAMEHADPPHGSVEVALTADGREVKTALQDMVLYLHHGENDPSLVVAEETGEGGFDVNVLGVIPGCAADAETIAIPLKGAARVRVVSGAGAFTDSGSASGWAQDAVNFVDSHGIFQGSGSKTFAPRKNLTRAGAVTALYNLAGRPRTQSMEGLYGDVSGTDWYEKAVSWAAEMGIAGGVGDGRFAPDQSVTRVQFAVMLWRSVGRPETTNKDLSYTDLGARWGKNGDDAVLALCWAASEGIMMGKDGSRLEPETPVTREEAAVMLMRLCAWKTGLTLG